jgi:NitT/TauT family transport system substrate-binding protein
VSIADLGIITQAPVYIAMDRGYFEAEGLEANLVQVRTVSETAELAATGQVDFGGMAPDPALFNALERDIQIKLLGSGGIFHRSLTGTSGIVVRQDLVDSGRYRELADLKGFKIAVGSVTSQFYVEQILNRAGLTETDVEFTTLALQDMAAGLKGRAIDAAWMVEPSIGAMRTQALGTQVASGFDAMQGGVSWLVFASPSAAGRTPEVAARFMRAYLRGLRDFHHAFGLKDASPDPVFDALAAHSSIHDRKVVENVAMHPVDPNGTLDIASLDRFQDYFLAHGAQNRKIDLTRYVDTAPLEAALETLGRL